MLFTLGHGQRIQVDRPGIANAAPVPGDKADGTISLAAVAPSMAGTINAAPAIGGNALGFGYYFKSAPQLSDAPDMIAKLDTLAAAMAEPTGDPESHNSKIPPIFTYLGQFIDHDITANTDRDNNVALIDGDNITPLPRDLVVQNMENLRNGALELDSLYGDGGEQGPFATKLAKLMRHPSFPEKMRLGRAGDLGGQRPPLPTDPAVDLLRLARLMGTNPANSITLAELNALPAEMRKNFLDDNGNPKNAKSIIGDDRNEENLIVAQLQVAWLRFHNKVVDSRNGPGSDFSGGNIFEWARNKVRWHYQWLVMNAYLPAVCDAQVVDRIKAEGAKLYTSFLAAHPPASAKRLPLPLEFSVSAFRFGHSMVRSAYDHNRFFENADFGLLFRFTGGANPPMAGTGDVLPENWIIEWERFTEKNVTVAKRAARKIDTRLAPPLFDMFKESPDPQSIFRSLALRNLRRGHRLNIPTAQSCLAALGASGYENITVLSESQLTGGPTGQAVADGGFASETPLWFYLLKEAEELAAGEHLGPLGSTLVAETLIGLILNDPDSYWNAPGSDNGHWQPADSIRPNGQPITSLKEMLRTAAVL